MDIAKFFIATKIAYYSLVFALYGIFVSLTSIVLKDKMSLYELFLLYSDILLLISVPLSLLWWFCMKEEKKNINNARNFNKQYQKYFKELYPDSEEYI